MLSKMDDYFIHQITDTIDHVGDSDPRFQDRLYFNVHSDPGDFVVGCGIGAFPNQNVMDGFVCAVSAGRQHNLRVARPLAGDREDMFAGPFRLEVLQPMEQWRMMLEPNAFGISFDLKFTARSRPFEHLPIFRRTNKQVSWHQQHFQQSGSYEGWIEIAGRRVEAGRLWGSRDRSWGVRGQPPGTPQSAPHDALPGGWLSAQFDDYAIHGWFGKDADDRNIQIDGAVARVGNDEPARHFVDWAYSRPVEGSRDRLDLTFVVEGGSTETLEIMRPILSRNTSGGGYDKGFFGVSRREVLVEGEIWNIDDPVFQHQHGTMHGEVLCEFRHRGNVGFGIFQSTMLKRDA